MNISAYLENVLCPVLWIFPVSVTKNVVAILYRLFLQKNNTEKYRILIGDVYTALNISSALRVYWKSTSGLLQFRTYVWAVNMVRVDFIQRFISPKEIAQLTHNPWGF
jgi:cytochrome b